MRLAGQAKAGFYPTPPRVVDMIAGLVYGARGSYRGQDVLRILDPCCGEGEAVAQMAEQLRSRSSVPIETYGVELHRVRADEAAGRLDRTLSTDLFQTSIGHGAFGLLYLNPPYDTDQEKRRAEHRFLTHCARYLAEDGLLVFIVPRRRLAVSARFLASHFWKLRCWAFPAPEREVFDQVVLIGYRRREPKLDEYALERVREWSEGEPEELYPSTYPELDAPTTPAGDVLFTTRTLDPEAAASEARRSGLWTSAEVTDSLWPSRSQNTRPLMPLRRGHMAMLTAAGFLDNLCLQAYERRILVKGRTTKEKVLAEATAETETYRERLRTTVVALDLGDGEITDIEA